MGDDDQPGAATGSRQRAEVPYEVATGEHLDDGAASAGMTIRPGSGVESVRVKVPGMDEFETGPEQLREWLQQHGLVQTAQQWTAIDQQLQDAIGRGHTPAGNQPAGGSYHWDDYSPGVNAGDGIREELNETQSADWTRMLTSWQEFEQQVNDLRSVAGDDAELIIGQIGHTITALNMIESAGWTQSCQSELGAWAGLSCEGRSDEAIHAAATSIADAGDTLMHQWHAAIDAGNYDSAQLTDRQQAFITACEQARLGLQ